MEELLRKLAAHRRRIKIARTAEAAARWAFYATVLACVYLTASKIVGLTVPRSVAATVLVAIPLGMAAREWARSFSLRDCAVYLDLALGLEERLSTAVEVAGAMEGAQVADAAGALARAKLPPQRFPREAKLLTGSLLLLAALLVIPAPRRSGAAGDLELESVMKAEAKNLEDLAAAEVEFREAAALVERGKLAEALARVQAIREKLEEKLLAEGSGAGSETQKILDRAAASAEALSAQLARLGRTIHAPPPVAAARKLERPPPPAASPPAEFVEGTALARSIAASLERGDWPPRYDPVVRKYFGRPVP